MFIIKHNKGFSMIEILVALVILAIGLLGMATLMINSMQTNQSAAMRSIATQAAYDLTERMRSNTDENVLKNKKYATGTTGEAVSTIATGAERQCNDKSAEALADCDKKVWARDLEKNLPGAYAMIKSEGTVTIDGQPQNRLWCIAIFWEDNGGKNIIVDDTKAACGTGGKVNGKSLAFYEVKVLL